MKVNLFLKNGVFVPCFDADYEKVRKLTKDTMYECDLKQIRNAEFNKKYHALIERAWDVLNDEQRKFFGDFGKDAFRKSLEITAGFFEPVFDFHSKKWQRVHKSTAFNAMSEDEFQELYNGVLSVLHKLLTNSYMTEVEYNAVFEEFYD